MLYDRKREDNLDCITDWIGHINACHGWTIRGLWAIKALQIPHMSLEILKEDNEELSSLEKKIQSGLQTFINVGSALSKIRDLKLYLIKYDTFEDYCRERWGMAARTAYQTIASSRIALQLDCDLKNEYVARQLGKCPEDQRKAIYLEALKACPIVTADHLRRIIARKGHIKQGLAPNRQICCPSCGETFEWKNIVATSRGNRTPSKAPHYFLTKYGKVKKVIDYGCGRLRNKLEMNKIADEVIFCDLKEQARRVDESIIAIPLSPSITAEAVFVIHVLHVQSKIEDMQKLANLVMLASTRYVIVETPRAQSYYKKSRESFRLLSDQEIEDLFPKMKMIENKWLTSHNKIYVFEHN